VKNMEEMTTKDMCAEYNELTGSNLVKFSDRKQAMARLGKAREEAQAAKRHRANDNFDQVLAAFQSGEDKDSVVALALNLGYTPATAEVQYFKAQNQSRLSALREMFEDKTPSQEEFVQAAKEMGMRESSAKKRFEQMFAS